MIAFPNSKINLGLRIIRKREDGFHDLETIFYPIPLKDILEILPAEQSDTAEFHSTGLPIPGSVNDNLCIKAYNLLKNDYRHLPGIRIHLHKIIPMGAGLGGGSSDASAVLKMLDNIFTLGINNEAFEKYALELGSDCPFFLRDEACYATGRGELLEPVGVDLSSWKILLVHPGIHINTTWAFSQIKPQQPANDLKDIIGQPVDSWKDELVNDFEKISMEAYPPLYDIKSLLYSKGAVYAAMTGTGSSFFALFPKAANVDTSDILYALNVLP